MKHDRSEGQGVGECAPGQVPSPLAAPVRGDPRTPARELDPLRPPRRLTQRRDQALKLALVEQPPVEYDGHDSPRIADRCDPLLPRGARIGIGARASTAKGPACRSRATCARARAIRIRPPRDAQARGLSRHRSGPGRSTKPASASTKRAPAQAPTGSPRVSPPARRTRARYTPRPRPRERRRRRQPRGPSLLLGSGAAKRERSSVSSCPEKDVILPAKATTSPGWDALRPRTAT